MAVALKVGMVGSGFIARFQATAMGQVRGIELTGVLDRKGTPALLDAAKAAGLGTPRVFKTIAEMAHAVDAIAVYSPNDTRLAVVEEIVSAVKAGAALKGIICEKPLGRTLAEARRLVELAAAAKLRTAYFENQIFMRALRVQLAQLEPAQRAMGPLGLSRTAEEHSGPHERWFWDPLRQGGGVLNDMGCHSIAVGWYLLTPVGKPLTFLKPVSVSCEVGLLKWGQPFWREQLLKRTGVDYAKTPAEDFATGVVTFENPETGQRVKSQFTNSWMFDRQGLRLFMDGLGPGYAFELNTLVSPLTVFIGDDAAASLRDAESALEKATSSRGLLSVQYNEADLYGYTDENADALAAFSAGRDGMLPWSYGLEITRLVQAAYLAAETRATVDLTHPQTQRTLESYVPMIAQGRGAEVLR
jgi:predicted dehydrogenase